uniref:glutathione transferase n=1 Tax=Daphnia magna TaxID=35525 RepID=A0A482DHQ8_9CRUS|nr:glutathione S-transferase sigma2 isoform a [Daphnia magna]
MPGYKLYYFNVRGRGELSRLILHCAGVPFEDFRFEGKDWPAIKPNMPFGQVPVLEIDGNKMLAQSHTVARYLARQHGLAGQNDWEQSQADMYVDCIYDMHGTMRTPTWETDPVKQKELFDKVNEETIQPHLEKVEQHIIKNGSGHLVGQGLTWADIAYYAFFTTPIMTRLGGEVFTKAPHLKKLIELVGSNPNIKKALSSCPAPNTKLINGHCSTE